MKARTKLTASMGVLNIFQLAAINGLRVTLGMEQVFHPQAIRGKCGRFLLQAHGLRRVKTPC
jgi:hypothetical protein